MITKELLDPQSIVIIGASNDTSKPGGKVLQNIIKHDYKGRLYAVNPKENEVQGVQCYAAAEQLPNVDLAIIAVAAQYVEDTMRVLAEQKNCKAFILFSAGFSEIGEKGRALEERCAAIATQAGASLIGPNCIGVITGNYKGVFAGPIPEYDPMGCDCVSASGATMVYILEVAIPRGLKFRNIYSIGNSAQIGVEDILEYWDNTFDPKTSSKIKLLYMEQIADPKKFLKHARSLTLKGCRIAAIKAGSTEAGSRAVSSHTGALAGSNSAINALFRKAGIIRCYSRVELVYVAAIFTITKLVGNRIAIITHAGGPGVMLTDVLTRNGMSVPQIKGAKADELLSKLHIGSSVANPIDFLATGTAEQLGIILDYVENEFDEIDGAVVVFGTTGMWRVDDVYEVLHRKMRNSKKPIFPILPSVMQAKEEVSHFHSMGHVNFLDETSFGYVLSRVIRTAEPYPDAVLPVINKTKIRAVIDSSQQGYLSADKVFELFDAAGINRVKQNTVNTKQEALLFADTAGFPIVMKVSGPVHKSDIGGVVLNVNSKNEVELHFDNLMKIEGADGVIMQQQLRGVEIYMGAKKEEDFGHQILIGLGGIFVEVFKDIASGLSPLSKEEANAMLKHLKSYPIIKGIRGKEGVNEMLIVDTMLRLSTLVEIAPEISEMDINPLLGNSKQLVAVDARICLDF
ncbi:MAG: acetate--CoA ligase family protein [Bacteroidetes bacterium]|nr:acetate--CoA ligase family protein [Bacteroidota bacterium]